MTAIGDTGLGVESRDDEPDAELLQRFQAGDDQAFEAILRRYDSALRTRATARLTRHLRRRISVSDVLQEARWAAYRGLRTLVFARPDALGAWLGRVVDGKVAVAARHFGATGKRSVYREESTGEGRRAGEEPDPDPTPGEQAIASEEGATARRALEGLPTDYREVLVLTLLRGLSLAEAGACMGRSRDAAKKLYGRAISRFTEVLATLGEGRDA